MMARFAKTVARKASSRAGASFIIALVFALAVAFVSVVVISSATVSAERATAANRADDQGYYAVASALEAAGDIVARDVCTSFSVTVAADGTASMTSGADALGLRAWARDQAAAIANGGTAQPKRVVVTASDMGLADVPDVLLIFTMANNGIYARACVDVWGADPVPADDAVLKADLVDRASYASFLTKQVASSGSLSGSKPLTIAWTSTGGGR